MVRFFVFMDSLWSEYQFETIESMENFDLQVNNIINYKRLFAFILENKMQNYRHRFSEFRATVIKKRKRKSRKARFYSFH